MGFICLLTTPEDLKWVRDVHLKDKISDAQFATVKSVALFGYHEDCPETVVLWGSQSPMMSEKPLFQFETDSQGELQWHNESH